MSAQGSGHAAEPGGFAAALLFRYDPHLADAASHARPPVMGPPMLKHYLNLPRPIHILCLGTLINRAGTFVVVFLTIYLTTQLRLDVVFATRIMGLYGLGAVFAAGVGGHFADHVGRRSVMVVALLSGAAVLVALSFVTTPWVIMVLVPAFGILSEMYRPAAAAMIADLTTPAQRSHAFGLMYVSVNLGFAIGACIGGLIAKYDFHWLFWGDAFTSAVYAGIIFAAIRETLPSRRPRTRPGTAPESASSRSMADAGVRVQGGLSSSADAEILFPAALPGNDFADASAPVPLRAAVRHILTNYPFLCFCMGNFFIALVFMQAMSTFPLFLEQRGFTPRAYGNIISLNGLLIVLLQLPLTSFLNRFHRGSVIVGAAVLNAIGFGLTGFAVTPWQFALTVVVWTFGEMAAAPCGPAIVSDFAPTALRARYMGAYGMSFSFAMVLAAPLGGEILGRPNLGPGVLWPATFVLSIIAALLYLAARRHLGVRPTA